MRKLSSVLCLTLLFAAGCESDPSEPPFAADIEIEFGNNQSVFAGQIVPVSPSVRVVDQYGNGYAGALVTFAVTGGGGSITGGQQFTDDDGVATVTTWRVGVSEGTNTVTATVANVGVAQFVATGNESPGCSFADVYTLFSIVQAELTEADCILTNEFYHDFYQATFAAPQVVRFTMLSPAFDTYLLLTTLAGNLLAEDNNAGGSGNSAITIFAPAGTIEVAASSAIEFDGGIYTLSSTLVQNTNFPCGETVYVMRGISVVQSLGGGDCVLTGAGGPWFVDEFLIRLIAGVSVTISLNSAVMDTYLELIPEGETQAVAISDDISLGNTNSQIIYTPANTGYYIVSASSSFSNETGPYTMTIAAGGGGELTAGLVQSGKSLDLLLRNRGVPRVGRRTGR